MMFCPFCDPWSLIVVALLLRIEKYTMIIDIELKIVNFGGLTNWG